MSKNIFHAICASRAMRVFIESVKVQKTFLIFLKNRLMYFVFERSCVLSEQHEMSQFAAPNNF